MSSSSSVTSSIHRNSRIAGVRGSIENRGEKFSITDSPTFLDPTRAGLFPGGQNDAALIRKVLVDAIKASGKSRAQLADEMSYLAGRRVTERMLNGYTAESREDFPFPLELARPFCTATGSDELMKALPHLHGLRVIDEKDAELVELGRAFLQRTQAEQQIADLQQRLNGRPR